MAPRAAATRAPVAAQGDQSVAIEVRAALGGLLDVMHLEAVHGETAGLAPHFRELEGP